MKFLLSILGMTNQCNLNCTYCDWEKDEYRNITEEEYKKVRIYLENIKKEIDTRYPELVLIEYTGGETLIYPKIIKILLSVFKDKWVRINTNGICISNEVLGMMKEHGKAFFAFSLDSHEISGNEPRFQDNRKIMKLVMNNFKKTLEMDIPIYLLCTINKYNIDQFPEYTQYLYENFSEYIERGMLAMPAHYVTNYEKENGVPTNEQNNRLKEFLITTDSPLIVKNYQHYKELQYYFENNNRLTSCTIPDWSLSLHYRKNRLIEEGNFISFGCGMRGIYDLGEFSSLSAEEINKYFDIADSKELLNQVLNCKSSSSYHYGCQEMCFTDWVCFDMIMQGKISLEDAGNWFVMFKDQKVIDFIMNYQGSYVEQ